MVFIGSIDGTGGSSDTSGTPARDARSKEAIGSLMMLWSYDFSGWC